jgi:hypothetical protein
MPTSPYPSRQKQCPCAHNHQQGHNTMKQVQCWRLHGIFCQTSTQGTIWTPDQWARCKIGQVGQMSCSHGNLLHVGGCNSQYNTENHPASFLHHLQTEQMPNHTRDNHCLESLDGLGWKCTSLPNELHTLHIQCYTRLYPPHSRPSQFHYTSTRLKMRDFLQG